MVVGSLIKLLIVLIVFGLVFWLLKWGIDNIGLPEPFNKVANVVLVLIVVVVLLVVLLNVLGYGSSVIIL